MIGRLPRRAVVLAASVLALSLGAQPALAATQIKDTGRTGYSEVSEPGGVCRYRDGNSRLKFINVFYPSSVHGDYPPTQPRTWVGWRFNVLRSTDSGTTWNKIYTSPTQKDRANDAIPADGFTNMRWYASLNPSGWYKVRVVILFYAPGSQTNVEGKTIWESDSFWARKGNQTYMTAGSYCTGTY